MIERPPLLTLWRAWPELCLAAQLHNSMSRRRVRRYLDRLRAAA